MDVALDRPLAAAFDPHLAGIEAEVRAFHPEEFGILAVVGTAQTDVEIANRVGTLIRQPGVLTFLEGVGAVVENAEFDLARVFEFGLCLPRRLLLFLGLHARLAFEAERSFVSLALIPLEGQVGLFIRRTGVSGHGADGRQADRGNAQIPEGFSRHRDLAFSKYFHPWGS